MTQKTDQTSGTTTGTGTAVPQAVSDHLREVTRNPTDYLSFFREIVAAASTAGVSQQQLLDSISDNYNSGRNDSSRRDDRSSR